MSIFQLMYPPFVLVEDMQKPLTRAICRILYGRRG